MDHLALAPSEHSSLMHAGEVEANGLTLHFEVGGDPAGEPVLLIMGLGAQMLHWTETFCAGLIQQGYRVIRFDNRDIGLSGKFRGRVPRPNALKLMGRFSLGLSTPAASGYTLLDMAEDTSQLIRALKLDRVHVIGASMGGMIAQILAASHPEQVRSLGLLFTSNNRALLPPAGAGPAACADRQARWPRRRQHRCAFTETLPADWLAGAHRSGPCGRIQPPPVSAQLPPGWHHAPVHGHSGHGVADGLRPSYQRPHTGGAWQP
jgi:pimeloyl-ACP methyl ester carboxylesterase